MNREDVKKYLKNNFAEYYSILLLGIFLGILGVAIMLKGKDIIKLESMGILILIVGLFFIFGSLFKPDPEEPEKIKKTDKTEKEESDDQNTKENARVGKITEDNWTWKNTLERLQHIDKIIETIVTRAIALNVGIIAAFGGIIALISKNLTVPVQWALLAMSIGGFIFIINVILAIQLARQECIRRWYFDRLKKSPGILEEILPPKYRNKNERKLICGLGDLLGYCVAWIWILFIMAGIFFIMGVLFLFKLN